MVLEQNRTEIWWINTNKNTLHTDIQELIQKNEGSRKSEIETQEGKSLKNTETGRHRSGEPTHVPVEQWSKIHWMWTISRGVSLESSSSGFKSWCDASRSEKMWLSFYGSLRVVAGAASVETGPSRLLGRLRLRLRLQLRHRISQAHRNQTPSAECIHICHHTHVIWVLTTTL